MNHLVFLLFVLITLAMLVVEAVLHLASWRDTGQDWDVYQNSKNDMNTEWQQRMRLFSSNTLFCVWVAVYIAQLIWLLYCVELSFHDSDEEGNSKLCIKPGPVPLNALVFLVLALGSSAAWSALMDDPDLWGYSLIFLLGICILAYLALGFAMRQLHRCQDYMHQLNHKDHVWLTRLFVHNALGLYATWSTVLLMYYSMVFLVHYDKAGQDVCRYVLVGLLGAYVLLWFIVDCFLLRGYSRGLILPYVAHMIALAMIICERNEYKDTAYLISAVLLAISVIFALIKIAMTIGAGRRPMVYEDRKHLTN